MWFAGFTIRANARFVNPRALAVDVLGGERLLHLQLLR